MSMPASSGQCWPNRFWIKWLAVFFGAVILGMILAVLTRPARETKADDINVYVHNGTGKLTPVNDKEIKIYFGDANGNPKRETLLHPFATRTQEAGVPIKLVIFLVDAAGKEQSEPYRIPEFKWPLVDRKTITIMLDTKAHTGSASIN